MVSINQKPLHNPSVLLVSLPWTCLSEPSLGLGILRAVLDKESISCRVLHLNLFLLEHLKAETYLALANAFAINDFLFSGILDPLVSRKQQQWLRLKTAWLLSFGLIDHRLYGGLDGVVQQLLHLRQEVIPLWLTHWADQIAASDVTLVGLTCNFDQTLASLALAYLVKKRSPKKLIALGGYAVHLPTGEAILKAFPCIDVVCTGEGEQMIARLARASIGEIAIHDVPNIIYREDDKVIHTTVVAPPTNMNSIPLPNYDDFFADLKMLADVHKIEVEVNRLPFEISRGCWWGQKKQCVFCGIEDKDLLYRIPNAEHVLKSMNSLSERYAINTFRLSGYIFPHEYYKTLLPELAKREHPYRINSEIKANVNDEQFALFAAAGFDNVQPGIESFSSDVLRKMHKGVSAIQNVYTILLGKRHKVDVFYNLLYGLPDDDITEITTMVRVLPRLVHLNPPATRLLTQITRYAPLQVLPERFSIPKAVYDPSYDLIFSSEFLQDTGFDLNDFCYYFERPFENSPGLSKLYLDIDDIVDAWRTEQARREVSLWYQECPEGLEIFDSRSEPPIQICLTPTQASVYSLISAPIAIETLRQSCCKLMDDEDFDKSLKYLDQLGLLFQDCSKVIGLALPKELYTQQTFSTETDRLPLSDETTTYACDL